MVLGKLQEKVKPCHHLWEHGLSHVTVAMLGKQLGKGGGVTARLTEQQNDVGSSHLVSLSHWQQR